MNSNNMYDYSVGYFYKEDNSQRGIYIKLPHGHAHRQRIEAAKNQKVDWDICLCVYQDEGSDKYFSGNLPDENKAIGISLDGKRKYLVDMVSLEKTDFGTVKNPDLD
jgi:hypothetical protein